MDVNSTSAQLLFTTVRIDIEDNSGDEFAGTGFIVDYIKNDKRIPFLVTNKHVIKDAKNGYLTFLRKENNKPVFGKTQRIKYEDFEKKWYGHPDNDVDVTVMPFGPALNQLDKADQSIFFISLPPEIFPTKEQQEELDPIEEIIFIGYPKTMRDEYNLTPITRKGITATPITLDYENKPIFLIDAPVFEGSSGSPVFIFNRGSYSTRKGVTIGTRLLLLGIVAKSTYYFEKGKLEKTEVKTKIVSTTRQFIDIGIVYKVRTINEAIENAIKILNPKI